MSRYGYDEVRKFLSMTSESKEEENRSMVAAGMICESIKYRMKEVNTLEFTSILSSINF